MRRRSGRRKETLNGASRRAGPRNIQLEPPKNGTSRICQPSASVNPYETAMGCVEFRNLCFSCAMDLNWHLSRQFRPMASPNPKLLKSEDKRYTLHVPHFQPFIFLRAFVFLYESQFARRGNAATKLRAWFSFAHSEEEGGHSEPRCCSNYAPQSSTRSATLFSHRSTVFLMTWRSNSSFASCIASLRSARVRASPCHFASTTGSTTK